MGWSIMAKKKKSIINKHHISYDPEIVVKIWKGEHQILTRLSWTKRAPSKAFVIEIKKWLKENQHKAIDLDNPAFQNI